MTNEAVSGTRIINIKQIRQQQQKNNMAGDKMKVAIGYDGSEVAKRAIETAIDLFARTKPEVLLITAIETPHSASSVNEAVFEELRKEIEKQLQAKSVEISDKGLEVHTFLVEGDPRNVLRKVVEREKPDILVVGARGKSTIEKMVLGSVSAYMVRHSPCPVLVVH